MVDNARVQYREEMFIGVGDIHPDGQRRTDGRTAGRMDGRTEPKLLSPIKKIFFSGG